MFNLYYMLSSFWQRIFSSLNNPEICSKFFSDFFHNAFNYNYDSMFKNFMRDDDINITINHFDDVIALDDFLIKLPENKINPDADVIKKEYLEKLKTLRGQNPDSFHNEGRTKLVNLSDILDELAG